MANWNDDQLISKSRYHIQKIVSSPISICIRIRVDRANYFLNFPRGKKVYAPFLSSDFPIKELRVKDKFSDFFKAKLMGANLDKIILAKNERAVSLVCGFRDKNCFISIFMKGNKSYFTYGEKDITDEAWSIFIPWLGKDVESSDIEPYFSQFQDLGFSGQEDIKELKLFEIENKKHFEQLVAVSRVANKKLLKLDKKSKKIENDIKAINQFQKMRVELLKFNQTGDITKINQWVPSKASFKSNYQCVDYLWLKVKKLKNALLIQKTRLENCLKEQLLEKILVIREHEVISPEWKERNKKEVLSTSNTVISYSYNGCQFAIGRSASENDLLRKNWANKDDWWIHPYEISGPHLFVRAKNSKLFPMELVEVFAGFILDHMEKYNDNVIDLVFTQVKYLKSLKGNAGSVTYKNHKVIRVTADNEWREKVSIHSQRA